MSKGPAVSGPAWYRSMTFLWIPRLWVLLKIVANNDQSENATFIHSCHDTLTPRSMCNPSQSCNLLILYQSISSCWLLVLQTSPTSPAASSSSQSEMRWPRLSTRSFYSPSPSPSATLPPPSQPSMVCFSLSMDSIQWEYTFAEKLISIYKTVNCE